MLNNPVVHFGSLLWGHSHRTLVNNSIRTWMHVFEVATFRRVGWLPAFICQRVFYALARNSSPISSAVYWKVLHPFMCDKIDFWRYRQPFASSTKVCRNRPRDLTLERVGCVEDRYCWSSSTYSIHFVLVFGIDLLSVEDIVRFLSCNKTVVFVHEAEPSCARPGQYLFWTSSTLSEFDSVQFVPKLVRTS